MFRWTSSISRRTLPTHRKQDDSFLAHSALSWCQWTLRVPHLLPARKASPLVTRVSPVSILKVVVFPAPFTPSRPKHWTGTRQNPTEPDRQDVSQLQVLVLHLQQEVSLTSPGGIPTHSRSTAGFCFRLKTWRTETSSGV